MGPSFKVVFTEFRTCESYKQCTGLIKKCQTHKKFSFQCNSNIHLKPNMIHAYCQQDWAESSISLSLSRTCLISKVKMTQQTREEGLGHSTCQGNGLGHSTYQGNKVMSLHWVKKNYKKKKNKKQRVCLHSSHFKLLVP